MSTNDDALDPTRRALILLAGSVAAASVLRCGGGANPSAPSSSSSSSTGSTATTACVVRPQLTEGPYYVNEMLNRSDLRDDPSDGSVRPGTTLRLAFGVTNAGTCAALAGALVDVWHCDALGVYSDVRDMGFNTIGKKYLRGYQLTDAAGRAEFTTVYPGWYSGRAVHLHFKVRSAPGAARGYEFTSQLFFDEGVTDQVHAQPPYNTKGRRNTSNASDGIYQGGGSQLLIAPSAEAGGYGATFNIGLQI